MTSPARSPERVDRISGRRRRGESLRDLGCQVYCCRNVVERCFNRLKQKQRSRATRYNKRDRLLEARRVEERILVVLPGVTRYRHAPGDATEAELKALG
ncbi:hypothetical protein ACIOJD_29865 [Streptomyces sp. NPDC088116]|uniref:hypothetical protein n=1 Tax=Streptomyces sp. NPDC088116 TaxID=3365825 RepID=UPI00382EF846